MNKHVLFLTEKWTDCSPQMGLSNHYHNVFGTFDNAKVGTRYHIHYDEYALSYKQHVDGVLLKIVGAANLKFDYCVVALVGDSAINPSPSILRRLHAEFNLPLIFIYPDTVYSWAQRQIKEMEDFATFVAWDCGEFEHPKVHRLWTPEDERLYHPDTPVHHVGFYGTRHEHYKDRTRYLKHLAENGYTINVKGGQRQDRLTPAEYAQLIRRTSINLNFCESVIGVPQLKGRVFEAIASKTLLLEEANPLTRQKFTPNVEYLEFNNEYELEEMISFALQYPIDADKIAAAGHERYKREYSNKVFWEKIECLALA